jgi:hypothetical protein
VQKFFFTLARKAAAKPACAVHPMLVREREAVSRHRWKLHDL